MENMEATRTCGQCHREVAEANFALHETHCSRFLCVCPDCDESVPKEQMDQHREEQHTEVRCSKCHQKMERRHLMDHEAEECEQRLQTCEFCELQLPAKELEQHRVACGSRTELCRECNRYIRLRDLPDHGSVCSAADASSGPPHTNNTSSHTAQSKVSSGGGGGGHNTSFLDEDITNHMPIPEPRWDYYVSEDEDEDEEEDEVEFSQLSSAYKSTSAPSNGPLGHAGDPDQIGTCPHCHLALPARTLHWHQSKCRLYTLMK